MKHGIVAMVETVLQVREFPLQKDVASRGIAQSVHGHRGLSDEGRVAKLGYLETGRYIVRHEIALGDNKLVVARSYFSPF